MSKAVSVCRDGRREQGGIRERAQEQASYRDGIREQGQACARGAVPCAGAVQAGAPGAAEEAEAGAERDGEAGAAWDGV